MLSVQQKVVLARVLVLVYIGASEPSLLEVMMCNVPGWTGQMMLLAIGG
jgi:hypothetical protein